jgi:AcrR family transcriptional regulator
MKGANDSRRFTEGSRSYLSNGNIHWKTGIAIDFSNGKMALQRNRTMTLPAKKTRSRPPAAAPAPKPYHRGDLPQALLAAAEAVLVRDGIAGLGLRSIAREAGVSHTAPKHHFGDTRGLLSELAAVGYRRLRARIAAAVEAAAPGERANAVGRAYIGFAYENPALFGLMFRNEMIDMHHPALAEATAAVMAASAAPLVAAGAPAAAPQPLGRREAMQLTVSWAYVHGLATLLIDQRLRGIVKRAPGFADSEELVRAILSEVRLQFDVAPAA